MMIGLLRTSETPPVAFADLLTMTCNYQGIKLLYMTPSNIDIKTGMVTGKMLIENEWRNIKTKLPKFIDATPYLFSGANAKKYQKEIRYLKKSTRLSINRRHLIQKDELQRMLTKHKELKELAIETEEVTTFEKLISFLDKHNSIILKPVLSYGGKNVAIIQKDDKDYTYIEEENKKITFKELSELYDEKYSKRAYVIQEYVVSRSLFDDPIDCRVHLEKNGNNEWEVARSFVRIGLGEKVVSNISQGGGISRVDPFLKANFRENWKVIKKKIEHYSRVIPAELEKYKNEDFMVMGLDLGLTIEGNVKLFEINTFPIVSPQRAEIARLRAGYYKFVLKELALEEEYGYSSLVKSNKKMLEEHKEFIKESKHLNKKLEEVKKSTSWKVTKPLRKIKDWIK